MKTRLALWPALLLGLSAIAQTNPAANLLVNGSFESPPGIYPYQVFSSGFGAMPGWTIESGTVEITAGTYWQSAEGAQSLDLNGIFESIGTIYQDFATVPGQNYRVRFAYAGNPECGLPTLKTANAYWNSQLLTNLSFDITGHSNTNVGWTYYEQTVTASGASSRIRFQATSPTFCGLTLDNVSVTSLSVLPSNSCVATVSDLMAWWPAEGNPEDIVGPLDGTTPHGIAYAPGVVNQAFDFNGSRRVNLPDADALKLTNSLTIEGWVFIRNSGGFILFRGDNRPGLDPYALTIDGQGRLQFHIESLTAAVNLLTPVASHTWQHVAATLDGESGDMRLYINGALTAQANTTIRPFQELDSSFEPAIGIGNHGGNFHNFPFDGLIDELSIYRRALSSVEIQAIQTAASSGKCRGATNPPSTSAVPVITTFNPVSATIGSAVTLTGTNFSPVAANNIVFFGAVRAPVVSASVSSLIVTVPAGATYAPITLTVSGLVAYAAQPFQPTFAGGGTNEITTASFAPRFDLAGGDGAHRSAIADLDGDGKPDLAVADVYGHTISLFRNVSSSGSLSNGSFAPRVVLPAEGGASDNPYGFVVADVDGDGKPDLVACDRLANHVSIYRNLATPGSLGTNSFATHINFIVGADPRYARVADLDGDGRPDIVSANYAANTISILRNIGAAGGLDINSFAPAVSLPAGSGPYDIAIGDLDGDNKPDLAVVCTDGPTLSLYRNLAVPGTIMSSSFAARVDLEALAGNDTIALGDLDGDGKSDLVFGSYQSRTMSVFRNQASPGAFTTSSFAARVDFATGNWTHTVALGDLNGDGRTDIASVGELESYLSVFQNRSVPGSFTNGSLGARVDFGAGWNAWGLSIGDLDGDGRPDLVFCNAYDDTVSIYQNVMPFTNAPPAQTNDCFPTPPGLVSWWPGEQTAADVGSGKHGLLGGNATYTAGLVGAGFAFDGAGDGVNLGNPADLQLQNFTIEAWIQRGSATICSLDQDLGPGGVMFSHGYGGYGLGVFDHGELFLTEIGISYVGSPLMVTDTNYHHVAVTKSGGAVVFYLDGAPATAAAYNPTFAFTTEATIGAVGADRRNSFLGRVDELAVFNRALTDSEIQAIYAAGSAGKCVVSNPPPLIPILAGPVTNSANGHWYFLLHATNWPAAEEIAVSLGGHLATINDAAENNWVFTTFGNFGGQERALWIGLTDQVSEGDWRWISGDPATYRNWSPIEPNSGGGYFADEDHALIWHPSSGFPPGSWNDSPSNQLWFAVVEVFAQPANHPPVAQIVVAPLAHLPGITNLLVIAPVCAPATVILDGSRSTDAESNPLQFFWSQGTNTFATGLIVTNQFQAGLHPIQLRVSDGSATGTNSIQLRVITPAQAVGSLMSWVQTLNLASNLNSLLLPPLRSASLAFRRCAGLAGSNQLEVFQNRVRANEEILGETATGELLDASREIIDAVRANRRPGPAMRISRAAERTTGEFRLRFTGEPGRIYFIEATTDWVTWETVGVAADLGIGQFEFVDVNAWRFPGRFYRTASP